MCREKPDIVTDRETEKALQRIATRWPLRLLCVFVWRICNRASVLMWSSFTQRGGSAVQRCQETPENCAGKGEGCWWIRQEEGKDPLFCLKERLHRCAEEGRRRCPSNGQDRKGCCELTDVCFVLYLCCQCVYPDVSVCVLVQRSLLWRSLPGLFSERTSWWEPQWKTGTKAVTRTSHRRETVRQRFRSDISRAHWKAELKDRLGKTNRRPWTEKTSFSVGTRPCTHTCTLTCTAALEMYSFIFVAEYILTGDWNILNVDCSREHVKLHISSQIHSNAKLFICWHWRNASFMLTVFYSTINVCMLVCTTRSQVEQPVTSAAFRLILVHESSSGISVWLQAGGVATAQQGVWQLQN